LAEAFRLASKYGPVALAELMAGRRGLDQAVVAAARLGDEAAVMKLLGVKKPPLKIGDRMLDGTIYVGVSPDSGKAFYAAAADTPLMMTFKYAARYAENLDACGHKDWRLPTRNELELMFANRHAIGGFNKVRDAERSNWYWSSTEHRKHPSLVWCFVVTGGISCWTPKDYACQSSRAVRSEP
jgi:hypothetical protein